MKIWNYAMALITDIYKEILPNDISFIENDSFIKFTDDIVQMLLYQLTVNKNELYVPTTFKFKILTIFKNILVKFSSFNGLIKFKYKYILSKVLNFVCGYNKSNEYFVIELRYELFDLFNKSFGNLYKTKEQNKMIENYKMIEEIINILMIVVSDKQSNKKLLNKSFQLVMDLIDMSSYSEEVLNIVKLRKLEFTRYFYQIKKRFNGINKEQLVEYQSNFKQLTSL